MLSCPPPHAPRLRVLTLSFSVAAVLSACGGAGGGDPNAASGASSSQAGSAGTSGDTRATAAAATTTGTTDWVRCADEWGTCSVDGTRTVRYGANGVYVTRSVTGSIACTNAVWGDPVVGVVKACDYDAGTATASAPAPAPAPAANWIDCAKEGQACALPGTRPVRYGANGVYAYRTATDTIACNNATWGDPIVGVLKACAYDAGSAAAPSPAPSPSPAPAPATASWVDCAVESQTCTVPDTRTVRYGAEGTYSYRTVTGSIACNNATWGDPIVGVVKACAYSSDTVAAAPAPTPAASPAPAPASISAMSQRDAVRLADQATFGATEALIAQLRSQGPAAWIQQQMATSGSRYTSGGTDAVHTDVTGVGFCDRSPNSSNPDCWRDWYSTQPLVWDFYRNALQQPDQLRQRVAFALQQLLVISGTDVQGTYGHRTYQNTLLDNAFGNYRSVLRKVALSPVMGDFLNNANNDKAAPNENFARELLQLFSIGTCQLNADGSLTSGNCLPTYDNTTVRNYAYALTGWTYPPGGRTSWGCWPQGTNCQYYGGDMVPLAARGDANARALLSGVSKAATADPAAALERVLDSLMSHPNMAPFVGRQLIRFLVSSNPSPGYVQRVAAAFTSGRFSGGGTTFGAGQRGDLAATVAAILLDAEARGDAVPAQGGRLRDPAQTFVAVLRAFNGITDGDALAWWWGETMRQHLFRAPTVFNFYPPDYPVAGTAQVGPAFGIHNADAALNRLNYLTFLFDWGGAAPVSGVPNAVGTKVRLDAFIGDAPDAARLVDRLSALALGAPLPDAQRSAVIRAVEAWSVATASGDWQARRVGTAAYLIYGSPNWQLQR